MTRDSRFGPGANPDSDSRTRWTARLIGCNVLTAVVLLIPIEFGLRLFDFEFALAPPRVEFGWPDPTAMEQFLADPDLLWVHPEYPDRVAAARGRNPSMVFMGDSCTQYGRYDIRLRSMARARNPGSRFPIVNLGVAGWSSWSGLQQLQRDVLAIQPKAITIFYGWNDHWKNFGIEDKDAARFLNRDPGNASRLPALSFFLDLRTARLADKALFASRRLFADSSRERVSLTDFRANLRQMVRIARDNDIIPILLTAPTSIRPGQEPDFLLDRWLTNLEDLVPLHRRYVQAVRDVASAENAPLVDLHQAFDQLPQPDLGQFFTSDGVHMTPRGDRKIAELIDRRLAEAGLYPEILIRKGRGVSAPKQNGASAGRSASPRSGQRPAAPGS